MEAQTLKYAQAIHHIKHLALIFKQVLLNEFKSRRSWTGSVVNCQQLRSFPVVHKVGSRALPPLQLHLRLFAGTNTDNYGPSRISRPIKSCYFGNAAFIFSSAFVLVPPLLLMRASAWGRAVCRPQKHSGEIFCRCSAELLDICQVWFHFSVQQNICIAAD